MKPDYKNWIPKGILVSLIAGTVLVPCAAAGFRRIRCLCERKAARRAGSGVRHCLCRLLQSTPSGACMPIGAFSYDGERKLSKQIIDGTAEHTHAAGGRRGTGYRLRQRCADHCLRKAQSQGKMIGIGPLGARNTPPFSLPLLKKNAAAEGVKNALFWCGNALKLDFPRREL